MIRQLAIAHVRRHKLFIHSLIPDISVAPLQVHYYSEALLTTALTQWRS